MFLREVGLEYRTQPINISQGEQFVPEFLRIAPNNQRLAMVDHSPQDGGEPLGLFESGANLLHVADKTVPFIPADLQVRNA